MDLALGMIRGLSVYTYMDLALGVIGALSVHTYTDLSPSVLSTQLAISQTSGVASEKKAECRNPVQFKSNYVDALCHGKHNLMLSFIHYFHH